MIWAILKLKNQRRHINKQENTTGRLNTIFYLTMQFMLHLANTFYAPRTELCLIKQRADELAIAGTTNGSVDVKSARK